MPFPIELVANDKELYPPLERAANALNNLQQEFRFSIVTGNTKERAYLLDKSIYTTKEIFEWLIEIREEPGFHPFLIMVIKQPLNGATYGNLFGSVSRDDKVAAFTVNNFNNFVYDQERYCRYYLIRYALSFVAPKIPSHVSSNCMFDNKINKRDILRSLNSGNVCDNCKQLLNENLDPGLHDALYKMLQVLSLKHPFAVVMKGGGVKGLAHAGALLELEKYFTLNIFAGTSAGGIAAILLGAGYTPTELEAIFQNLDFSLFTRESILSYIRNFIFRLGIFSGKALIKLMNELLDKKCPNSLGSVLMKDLKHRAVVYATAPGLSTVCFDSEGDRKEALAAFATRCTMSIPGVFTSPSLDDKRVFDGGLRNNFPLKRFMDDNPTQPVIALYLYAGQPSNNLFANLIEVITDNDEREMVNRHKDKVVIINTHPIRTMDFGLTKAKKDYLVMAGRMGALKFIMENYPDLYVDEQRLADMENQQKKLLQPVS